MTAPPRPSSSSQRDSQPLFSRLWGSGFLPADHQGVPFRSSGDPVLYLQDPPGMSRSDRRVMLDGLAELNRLQAEQVVAKLVAVLELRDPNLATHGRRTGEIATAIGGQLGMGVDDLDRVYLAGVLHDIGKLGVSEAILWKPAGLNRAEWREIRTHPEEGHRLVADIVHDDIAAAVLYHHERVDGDGYPFGLHAMSVALAARVVQVADAIDAMTSDRPYQAALPMEIARDEIKRVEAGHLPTLDLVGSHNRSDTTGGLTGGSETRRLALPSALETKSSFTPSTSWSAR